MKASSDHITDDIPKLRINGSILLPVVPINNSHASCPTCGAVSPQGLDGE